MICLYAYLMCIQALILEVLSDAHFFFVNISGCFGLGLDGWKFRYLLFHLVKETGHDFQTRLINKPWDRVALWVTYDEWIHK